MHLAQTTTAGIAPRDPHAGARSAAADSPTAQQFLNRLAKTIQLMRLDHSDAHLYRDGCDALVQGAIRVADQGSLEQPLTDIMSRVAVGDYHRALATLRPLTQAGVRS